MDKTVAKMDEGKVTFEEEAAARKRMLGVLVAQQLLGPHLLGEDGVSFREVMDRLSDACEEVPDGLVVTVESEVWDVMAEGAARVAEICFYRSAVCRLGHLRQSFDDKWHEICIVTDAYCRAHTRELAVVKERVSDALAAFSDGIFKLEDCFDRWGARRADRLLHEAVDMYNCLCDIISAHMNMSLEYEKMQKAAEVMKGGMQAKAKTPAPEAEKAESESEVATVVDSGAGSDGGPTANSVKLDKVDKGGDEHGEE